MNNVKVSIMKGVEIGHFVCDRFSLSSGKGIVESEIRAWFNNDLSAKKMADFVGVKVIDLSATVGNRQKESICVKFPLSKIDYFTTA